MLTILKKLVSKVATLEAATLEAATLKLSYMAARGPALETFLTRKAIAKSQTLRLQGCFIHIFLL